MRVEGLPIPYSIPGDDILSLIILICALLSITMAVRSWRYISLQARNLFSTRNINNRNIPMAGSESALTTTFIALLLIMAGMIVWSLQKRMMDTEHIGAEHSMMFAFIGIFVAYYILHVILCRIVMPVFFSYSPLKTWHRTKLFIDAFAGAFVAMLAIVHLYAHLGSMPTLIILFFIAITALLLRFYKAWNIFFKKKRDFVPFFLYLCTLEIVPIALLIGTLRITTHYFRY